MMDATFPITFLAEVPEKVPEKVPADYYLTNFNTMLDFVIEQYPDLLSTSETCFINRFSSTEKEARQLYVRLICRKGPLFRSDKLKYAEIPDISASAELLEQQGLLTVNPELKIESLAKLLTKAELLIQFPVELKGYRSRKKSECVERLVELNPKLSPLSYRIYQPLYAEEIESLQFLFFGNLFQDLTEFVLQNLGLTRYESYPLNPQNRLFNTRLEFDNALELSFIAAEAAEAEYSGNRDELVKMADHLPESPNHPLLHRRYCHLIHRIGRELERRGASSEALRLYQQSSMPPARERTVRILEKENRTEQAIEFCEVILNEPLSDMEKAFAQRFKKKLRGERIKRTRHTFPEVQLELPETRERVELQVEAWYRQKGWQACYVENTLMTGMAGLYFWEQIFSDCQGAFFHPFQSAPADFLTADFYRTRRLSIQKRLEQLDTKKNDILQMYDEKRGVSNALINWSELQREWLERACTIIPSHHLAAIFSRLMFDIAHNRSGFPDLILFNESEQSYRWVEVKGPGDRLQDNQKQWFSCFVDHGIPCEVAYVSWYKA